MDGLTGAASGMAVVSLAFQLAHSVKKLCDFWNSINEAPEYIGGIAMDLNLLSSILARIAYEAQHVEPDATLVNALSCCSVQVKGLSALLAEIEPGFSSSSLRMRKWTAFKAVMKRDHLTKFQSALDSLKATLLLMQQNICSRLTRNHYISLEQNLVDITQNISNLKIQQQSQTAKKSENLALGARSDQTGSFAGEWDAPEFSAESLQDDEINGFTPISHLRKQIFVRRRVRKEESIMDSVLGTFLAVSTTRLRRLKEAGDQPDLYVQDEYECETAYTIHPAPWLVWLGVRYGLNARLLSSSTLGLPKILMDAFRPVPDDALIFELCRQGNVPAVRSLFSRGLASVRDTDYQGRTPLHFAAENHHPELCRILRVASADENALTHDGKTPMEYAVMFSTGITPGMVTKAFDTLRLLADSLDFSDEDGNGWRLTERLCIYPLVVSEGLEALAALRLRMLRLLSFDLKTYFIRKQFVMLLSMTLVSSYAIEDAAELLMNLGGAEVTGITQNGIETSDDTDDYPILHYCLVFDGIGDGIAKLLTKGVDLHQLGIDDGYWRQEESPTSLAMYSLQVFANWLHQLAAIKVDLAKFAREEFQRNYMVHPGWSEQSLVSLFEFGYEYVFNPWNEKRCSGCECRYKSIWVEPYWRHLLERIKQRIEPDILDYTTSEEESEESANTHCNVEATETWSDQAQNDETLGNICADDLNKLSSDSERDSAFVSGLRDVHEYPANVSAQSDCLYAREEFVCIDCWVRYVRTGHRNRQLPEILSDDDDTSTVGYEVSEGDFSPYLIHS